MTHRVAGSGRRIPRIWLFPIAFLTAILGATAAGVFSRALLLDLVAWWPVWLAIGLLTYFTAGRRIGKVRAAGLVPIVTLAVLGLFMTAHLGGWNSMPSSSTTLIGPDPATVTSAALSARLDGEVVVNAGSESLYVVAPLLRGGNVGVAEATEQVQGSAVSVVLNTPPDPGFYAFSGWDVSLSSFPTWDITLDGDMEVDLGGLRVSGLLLTGNGLVTLGDTFVSTPANVSGDFEIVVPAGVAAKVIGQATVPSDWDQLPEGWRSPSPGEGWVISVASGASLVVANG
jgi:hypothetical protein